MKTTEPGALRSLRLLLVMLLIPPATVALADTSADELLQQLKTAHPATHFTAVTATPVAGLYQVQMQANHAFVLAGASRYFLFGTLFDTQTLTEIAHRAATLAAAAEAQTAPPSLPFDTLPLNDAITTVHGNGRARLAVFSDPACPYCRQLEQQLQQLDDVTLYTFPLAYLGEALPRAIWCAADPAMAWQQHMRAATPQQAQPGSTPDCINPLQRTMELARRLAIQATPTLIYADGSRSSGVVDSETLRRRVADTQEAAHRTAPQPAEPRP